MVTNEFEISVLLFDPPHQTVKFEGIIFSQIFTGKKWCNGRRFNSNEGSYILPLACLHWWHVSRIQRLSTKIFGKPGNIFSFKECIIINCI